MGLLACLWAALSHERPTSGTKLQEMADGLALPAVRSVKLTHQQQWSHYEPYYKGVAHSKKLIVLL